MDVIPDSQEVAENREVTGLFRWPTKTGSTVVLDVGGMMPLPVRTSDAHPSTQRKGDIPCMQLTF